MLTLLVKLSEKLRMNITDRVRGLLVPVTVSKKRKADIENSSEESMRYRSTLDDLRIDPSGAF